MRKIRKMIQEDTEENTGNTSVLQALAAWRGVAPPVNFSQILQGHVTLGLGFSHGPRHPTHNAQICAHQNNPRINIRVCIQTQGSAKTKPLHYFMRRCQFFPPEEVGFSAIQICIPYQGLAYRFSIIHATSKKIITTYIQPRKRKQS